MAPHRILNFKHGGSLLCWCFSEGESGSEAEPRVRSHKKEKKHKHKHKHKHRSHSTGDGANGTGERKHKHKHKHKKHKRSRDAGREGALLENTELADLEQARALLAAQLDGRAVEAPAGLNENVISAMSLIAQGYQSESEEEGEVDHSEIKQTYIESGLEKIQEIMETQSQKDDSGESVVYEGMENQPDNDVKIIDEEPPKEHSPPASKRRRFTEDGASKKSSKREPPREREREREPSQRSRSPLERKWSREPGRSSSPGRRNRQSPPPGRSMPMPRRDKENRSPPPRVRTRDDYDRQREAHNRGERFK